MTDHQPNNDSESDNISSLIIASFLLILILAVAIIVKPDMALFILSLGGVSFGFIWFGSGFFGQREPSFARRVKPTKDQAAIYGPFAEALQDPVFVIGARGTIRYLNGKAKEVFVSTGIGELLTVRFRQPDLRRAIEKALNSKRTVSLEYNEAVPDNRWFMVEIAPIPQFNERESQEDSLFAVVFHEQTETKRIDQMRSDFIANASHELRTPLASLVGYLETINGPAKKDEKAREKFVGVMLEQAERMSRLVNDLLSLSRIEMKTHLKPSDTVNLTEIMSSVVDSLGQLAHRMGVTIKFDKADDVFVLGDRDDLLQVFENVIENGCKYGQDGGQVDVALSISTDGNTQTATVSVKDYGPGIPFEHQQRITERFYRVDVEQSREKQGTGLGLAIVKHILQRHDTRLQIISKLGEGTEFRIPFASVSVEKPKK